MLTEHLSTATVACREHSASQKPEELATFLAMVEDSQPEVFVELGAGYGGSLYAWQRIAHEVYTIDVNPVYVKDFHGATLIQGDTRDKLTMDKLLMVLAGRPIDVLFIDADHAYENVKHDYFAFRDLVAPQGFIGIHDIVTYREDSGVPRFWAEIKANDPTAQEIIHRDGGDWGGIGVLRP